MNALMYVTVVFLIRGSSLGLATDSDREYFSVHPASQNVTEGSNVTFMCQAADEMICKAGFPTIHWVYETFENLDGYVGLSGCFQSYKPTRYNDLFMVNSTSSGYFLHLLNVTSDSNGVYYCQLNATLPSDYAHLHVIKPFESPPRPNSTITTATWRPQLDGNLQCNFSPSDPREGEQVSLRCRQPAGGQDTLTWSSENLTLASHGGETLSQENFHNVTHVLGKDDNCARFTCLAQSNAKFCGVSQCEVIPFKLPVSLSPSILTVVEKIMGIFHCNTESTTVADYKWFIRRNWSDKPPQAVGETDQFRMLEAGKSLRVKAPSLADNGTEVKCEVEYQPNCSQSSSWSVLLISASHMTTPPSDSAYTYTHLSSDQSPSNKISNYVELLIGGGVALLFLLAIIGGVAFYLLCFHKRSHEQPPCSPSSGNVDDVEMVGWAERNPKEPVASVTRTEVGDAIYAVSSKHKSSARPTTSHEQDQDIGGFQDGAEGNPKEFVASVTRIEVGDAIYAVSSKRKSSARPTTSHEQDQDIGGFQDGAEGNPKEPVASVTRIEVGEAIYTVSSKHKSSVRPMTSHEQDIVGFQDDSESITPASACSTVPERRVGTRLTTVNQVNQVSEGTASSSCPPDGDHRSTTAEQTLPAASIQHYSPDDSNAAAITYAELELGGHPRTDFRENREAENQQQVVYAAMNTDANNSSLELL